MIAFIDSGISLLEFINPDFRVENNAYRVTFFSINNYNETSARTTLEFLLFVLHFSELYNAINILKMNFTYLLNINQND